VEEKCQDNEKGGGSKRENDNIEEGNEKETERDLGGSQASEESEEEFEMKKESERSRIEMILKAKEEKKRRFFEERKNQCRFCHQICTRGKLCNSRDCRRRSLLSQVSETPTRKCMVRGCETRLSERYHGNFCRGRDCIKKRRKDQMKFTRVVAAALNEEEEKEVEEMEEEFYEEIRSERERKETQEMIEMLEIEIRREQHPEHHVEEVLRTKKNLLRSINYLKTCFPQAICFNCGILLWRSDLHWVKVADTGPDKPAESYFSFIPGIEGMVKEKERRIKGETFVFMTSCGFCSNNHTKNFAFLQHLDQPRELQDLNMKEQQELSLVRFNCFLTKPLGNVFFLFFFRPFFFGFF